MILAEDVLIVGFMILVVSSIVMAVVKMEPLRIFISGISIAYAVSVLAITLCPIPYDLRDLLSPVTDNFIPFKTILEICASGSITNICIQIIGNMFLAFPYGVLIEYSYPGPCYCIKAFIFPAMIEVLQFLVGFIMGVHYRSFDVDDILLNTAGALAGMILCRRVRVLLMQKTLSKSQQ